MRRALALWLLLAACLYGGYALSQSSIIGGGVHGDIKVSAGGACSAYTNYAARTGGSLSSTVKTALQTMICNLVTDGIWSQFDFFYFFAVNTGRSDANLNLVSSSFTAVEHPTPGSSPAWSATTGYTGVDNSSTVFLDTQFAPATASSPQMTVSSIHYGAWIVNNAASCVVMGQGTGSVDLLPDFSGTSYFRPSTGPSVATANSLGHFIANRSALSGTNVVQGYRNGSNVVSGSQTGSAVWTAIDFIVLAGNTGSVAPGSPTCGGGFQVVVAHGGSSLSSGNAGIVCHQINLALTSILGTANVC